MYHLMGIFICTMKEKCSDNENIHEAVRTTVKTLYLIISATENRCIRWIQLWQNERQRSVNHFSSCKSGYYNVYLSLLSIIIVLAAILGKRECYTLSARS